MRVGKQPSDVLGNKIKCPNYQMCPVCYGCRAYDSSKAECEQCYKAGDLPTENRNFNVCNRELHETWKLDMMISKDTIELKEEDL